MLITTNVWIQIIKKNQMVRKANSSCKHTWIFWRSNARELVANSLAMPLPMVLDEIITKMCASGIVLDVPIGLKKCLDLIRVSWRFILGSSNCLSCCRLCFPDHVHELLLPATNLAWPPWPCICRWSLPLVSCTDGLVIDRGGHACRWDGASPWTEISVS
jgi:hypothetical protein